mgnify:FL=1
MKKIVSLLIIVLFLVCGCSSNKLNEPKEKIKTDFKGMLVEDVDKYAKEHDLVITKVYEFSDEIKKDIVIESNLEANKLSIKISKGSIPLDLYKEKSVNELGKVPIMMYHGIRKKASTSTGTIGGNVDKDGYNRTPDAFREDLEFYYKNGYRMIRLNDYINDFIDVELGYSPIILTFDDGNADNFKVIGKNDDGSLKFDPDSAIGILESFKEKYPDFKITATFFLTGALCNQPDYNEEIIKWLVENGYDVGNHTKTHLDIKKSSGERVQKEIAYVYDELEKIIPDKYVKIIALPFGSPYKKTHENYKYVLETNYNDKTYKTDAALRVGWEPEVSPFSKYYDKTFLKRCRAYDNNSKEFDIAMVFNMLKKNRFISDGEPDFITILESDKDKIKETDKKIITLKED